MHEHDDPRHLFGYCFKEHVKFASLLLLKYAVAGAELSIAYLKDAYKYWLQRAMANEGGEANLNVLRPGQHAGTHTITRSSLLPDVEYFEHERGLAALRLTIASLAAHMWCPRSGHSSTACSHQGRRRRVGRLTLCYKTCGCRYRVK